MEWQDQGIILTKKLHGERASLLSVLTKNHGRVMGMARGQKRLKHLEPMTLVDVSFKSRLEEHLGNMTLESVMPYHAMTLHSSLHFYMLSGLASLLHHVLAECAVYEGLFDEALHLLQRLETPDFLAHYVHFEVKLLAHLGYALRLDRCALTGSKENLMYVSPKTGRAASNAAASYASKLLKLPAFLYTDEKANKVALYQGLVLTGYFIQKHCFKGPHTPLPFARLKLQEKCLEG